jgi:bile acid:Na+ symporter, BASS family
MNRVYRYSLTIGLWLVPISIALMTIKTGVITSSIVLLALALFLIGTRSNSKLSQFTFTTTIVFMSVSAILFPSAFTSWGGIETKNLVIPLLQITMFGMGAAMSHKDFIGVIKLPKAVGIGLLCQFTIMPLSALLIATSLNFSPEIAAGIILLGASPSGLASNVMTYISNGNLALSVTLTSISTMAAPVMTPFLLELLAGQFISLDFGSMVATMAKMVVVPVAAGVIFNYVVGARLAALKKLLPKVSMAAIVLIIAIVTAAGREHLVTIGAVLIIAAIVHNLAGYILGYWSCRLAGISVRDSRTIALEVGLQNSGLASGLAIEMGKVASMGLPSAIFSSWMNFSGSFLANYWQKKPVD